MDNTVSVIVPIYKVEEYLPRCVDSILCQSYTDLEIILVDDGSPDGCGAICDAYAKKDPRIRVIHKPNGGLSDARNAGLDIATGEFVYFLDSDDWISPDAISSLYRHMDDSVDIVAGSSVSVREEDGQLVEIATSIPSDTLWHFDRVAAMKDSLLRSRAAWNRLFRRKLFQTIRFPVGRINEDEAIMLHVLDLCNATVQIGQQTYFYFHRPNSITTSSFSEKKMDWFDNCEANYAFIRDHYPQLLTEAEHRIAQSVTYLLRSMLMEPKRFERQIERLHTCLDTRYRDLLRNPYTTKDERKWLRSLKVILSCKLGWLYRALYDTRQKLS